MATEKELALFLTQLWQTKQESVLDAESFRQTALEQGLTESDLIQAQQLQHQCYLRGQGKVRFGAWQQAIPELELATALDPFHKESFYELAKAYKMQWLATAAPTARQNAERAAQRCLALNPEHEETLQLLAELERYTVKIPDLPSSTLLDVPTKWLLIGIVAGVGIVTGIILLFFE